MRAAIASVLNADQITDVPHFMAKGDDQDGHDMFLAYLRSRGLLPYVTAYPASVHSLEDIQTINADVNPGVTYLLFGKSGDTNHVVICRDGKVIHDPEPFPGQLTAGHDHPGIAGGIWMVMVLVPMEYK